MNCIEKSPPVREKLCRTLLHEIEQLVASNQPEDKIRLIRLKQTYGLSDRDLQTLLNMSRC